MGDHDFKLNVDSLIERLLEGEHSISNTVAVHALHMCW